MAGQILRGCSKCGRGYKPRSARDRFCPDCGRGNADRSPTTQNRPPRKVREQLLADVLAGGPLCAIQGPGCTGIATTMDHITPVVFGGTWERSNLRPACLHCNSTEGGKLAHQTRPDDAPADVPRQAPLGGRLH